jgi:hypothetical protein
VFSNDSESSNMVNPTFPSPTPPLATVSAAIG